MQPTAQGWNLCYLSAALVGTPVGQLGRLAVCGRDGTAIGMLDGVLIDSRTRRLSHLVVKRDARDGTRRELIPVESLIYLTSDQGGARLEVDADALVTPEVDVDAMPLTGDAVDPWPRA